jgi:hypothetical protein
MPYFVTGGAYRDTTFIDLVDPDPVEGPFEHYADAYLAWRSRSMAHVDDAFWRYEIVEAERMPDVGPSASESTEEASRAAS